MRVGGRELVWIFGNSIYTQSLHKYRCVLLYKVVFIYLLIRNKRHADVVRLGVIAELQRVKYQPISNSLPFPIVAQHRSKLSTCSRPTTLQHFMDAGQDNQYLAHMTTHTHTHNLICCTINQSINFYL